MDKFSISEIKLIAHSLGIDVLAAAMSHKRIDKSLSNTFYRNYYQSNDEELFRSLVHAEYAYKISRNNLWYYHITESGIAKFKQEFKELVNYQKYPNRDIHYLRNRINFYCDWCNYNFGNDNAGHVISVYFGDYSLGHNISHTTRDCIRRFLNELKALKKTMDLPQLH